jgi:hypothetical protein
MTNILELQIKKNLPNRIELTTDSVSIYLEITGFDIRHVSDDFAVWMLLPIAMKYGKDLHIKGTIDPAVIRNAEKLSYIWAMWVPGLYSTIKVTADHCISTAPPQKRAPEVILFSGGIDSTHAMIQRGRTGNGNLAVTVHGMDYKAKDDSRFESLMAKGLPLIQDLAYESATVKTNAAEYVAPLSYSHGFLLASILFLFSQHFKKGVIASDCTWEQDMLISPWGSNHVTNEHFASEHYKLETAEANFSRIQKISAISAHPIALNTVSFCKNYKFRPDNCGQCTKCIRTKTMFIAELGSCPPIFNVTELTKEQVASISLEKKSDFMFFFDVVLSARVNGNLEKLAGLEIKVERYIEKQKALQAERNLSIPKKLTRRLLSLAGLKL